jgi:DNA-binding transcriptional regulator GbsR (MarR family)
MGRKIKVTEEQLKGVMKSINEDTYDQALTTHMREKEREVFMSKDDGQLMAKLGQQWCETRVNHPDCEKLMGVIKKLKLDQP